MAFEPPIVALGVAQADPARVPECVGIADNDFDWLHVDVADGHFVPHLTYGAFMLKLLRRVSHATLDVHVLGDRPASLVEPLATAGAGSLTFHPCVCDQPRSVIGAIRAAGMRAGVALGPDQGFESVRRLLPEADLLLVATASIQYDGAPFMSEMLARVQNARQHREREGLHYLIQVEGAIELANMAAVREAGADVFVVGGPIFAVGDPATALAMFRAAARNESLHGSRDGVTHSPVAQPRVRYIKHRAA